MQARIEADIKSALRRKDTRKLSTLRLLKSALENARIEQGSELSDEEAVKVLQKQAKQRRESIEGYQAAGRTEQADQEAAELTVIEQYLPEPLTNEELEALVEAAIAEAGAESAADIGQVMRILAPKTGGRADGGQVASMVKSKLA